MRKALMVAAGLIGLGMLLNAASAPAARTRRVALCAVPAHARLVAQSSAARIVVYDQHRITKNDTDIIREWQFCSRASRGYHVLVDDASYAGGFGDIVHVDQVVLAGSWAAWTTTALASGGRYGVLPSLTASARELASRNATEVQVKRDGTCGASDLVLTPAGVAAWVAASCGSVSPPVAASWTVQVEDGRTRRNATLDFQQSSGTDPFAHLELFQCLAGCAPHGRTTVWWQRDGAWASAAAP